LLAISGNWQAMGSFFSVQPIGSSRQPLFFQLRQLAAADSLFFFSSGNWQQPTASIFSIEAIGSSRRPLFF
jgi:hypothetical protein